MALQTTRMTGLRNRDSIRGAVADQQLGNQMSQPVRRVHQPFEQARAEQRTQDLNLLRRPRTHRVGRKEAASGNLNFDQQERVARFTLDRQERSAKFHEDVRRSKEAEVRAAAAAALAERNTAFAQGMQFRGQNFIERRDVLDRARQSELDRRRAALEDSGETRAQKSFDEQQIDRIRSRKGQDEDRKWTRIGRKIATDTTLEERRRSGRRWEVEEAGIDATLEAMRNPTPQNIGQLAKDSPGFLIASARQQGFDNTELYDDEGMLTPRGEEFLQTIDVLSRSGNVGEDELIQRAAQHVGLKTSDEVREADIRTRLGSEDGKVRKQAKREMDELNRLRAQQKREQLESQAQAERTPPEEIQQERQTVLSAMTAGSPEEFQRAVLGFEVLYEEGALEPSDLSNAYTALVEMGRIKPRNSRLAVNNREIMSMLGISGSGGNNAVAHIAKELGVNREEANRIYRRAIDVRSNAHHMRQILDSTGLQKSLVNTEAEEDSRRLQALADIEARLGL
jgi:hypothetical protein